MLGTIWREATSEKSVDANTDSPFKDLQMLKFPDNCLFQTAKYMYLYKIGLKFKGQKIYNSLNHNLQNTPTISLFVIFFK